MKHSLKLYNGLDCLRYPTPILCQKIGSCLNPWNLRMEMYLKKGPWRCNYMKMRPYWIRVGPKSIGAAQKSDTTEHTHTHTKF